MVPHSFRKVIFLDIRNVLLFFDPEKMLRQIAEYCNLDVSTVKKTLEESSWREEYETGLIDSRSLFHALPQEVRGSKGFPGWMDAISNIFTPNSELSPLIKLLKNNQIEIFTLSNICEAHFGYAYTHFPSLHLCDGHILSYETKKKLPDSAMFEEALSKALISKEGALYVSASSTYVQKAQLLSIDSYLYENPEALFLHLQQKSYLP